MKSFTTPSKIKLIITLILATTLFGCSFHTENMVANKVEYTNSTNQNVSVGVTNGTSGAVVFFSKTLDVNKFTEATIISLKESKLFSKVSKEKGEAYNVKVEITYAASAPGFSMTGFVNSKWSIINAKTDEVVWSKFIKGQGHATMGDTMIGEKRQIMAIEKAAKDNITKAMNEIDKANLKLK